ncbi:aldehyde dehydrogenase family protein [Yinghuangia soli]|uniref:Aldehyde dehydrogenase family protein n=1 Tax=Yinghuangia soli TaxID=2908204 RepID=A0AA41Q4Q8_9ACTN|nr:aldehyde dehydrogenase family protein [Yinghuangia soli]MCF2531518.1 aldehyde dehydrogenase family protein [Yinghuangia soli]
MPDRPEATAPAPETAPAPGAGAGTGPETNGASAPLDPAMPVHDPRPGRVTHTLAAPTRTELADLCRALRVAQPAWERRSPAERADALVAFADALERHGENVLAALAADTGRVVESRLELDITVAALRRWAANAPGLLGAAPERPSEIPWIGIRPAARAYELVGVISPWNSPPLLSFIDAIPALAAGSSVVVKPSEVTPRFVAAVRAAAEEVPALAAVLGLVEGGAGTGAALVASVDLVAFTGSVPTGRTVARAAAERLIPVCLELGGKDPAIVCRDADLDHATSAILWGGTANAGQSCLSIERVYVHADRYAEFVGLLADKAAKVGLAHPDPALGGLGPIIDPDQAGVIQEHLDDAYTQGARAVCGGTLERIDGGTYLRPTVLTGVHHGMRVMTEETFGPILPVMPFATEDEAVALAEDSPYGLSAAVFAADAEAAVALAARLSAGAISINDAALTAVLHEGEKNAFKQSGIGGSRMGPASLARFLRRQSLLVHRGSVEDPWWHRL